jgi:lipopolysaccharide biosynthesis glycosyltransferase
MIADVIKVFIGFDKVESVAWHTMAHSLLARSSRPLALIPIYLPNLKGVFERERDPKQSNAFSFSRFLVPHLCGFQGHALYFDCDMMLRTDIAQIFDVLDSQPDKALYVVKHDYEPKDSIKYLGRTQLAYPRKNWSSVILWNCGHPANKAVTPKFVETATGLQLHRFTWLQDEDIGELDVRWNWLVGDYENPPENVFNVHWTVGGPYFTEYRNVDFSDEWRTENAAMNHCEQRIKP